VSNKFIIRSNIIINERKPTAAFIIGKRKAKKNNK
jgi:hypothetical protein